MLGRARRLLLRTVLLEAGAAIIFFGSLMQQPELAEYGNRALQELSLRGYDIPTADDPVRAYPAATSASFSPYHAGSWRPGVMSVRQHPQGSANLEMFLRHELMHEASFRTCKGKLPLWAEEAAAVSFSGELTGSPCSSPPPAGDLENLRRRVRVGASLDQEDYRVLTMLVACYGWPAKACTRSEAIEKLLQHPPASGETGFSYLLVSLLSGRILESQGDLDSRYPPGSLLKIPYAAALKKAGEREGSLLPSDSSLLITGDNFPEALGKELAESDTLRLLARKDGFDQERFRFLISPVREAALGHRISQEEFGAKDEKFWRQYLGERGENGGFPLEANLPELVQVLRVSLLYRPAYFAGLSLNGFMEGSTLHRESDRDKRILGRLHALSKTGTVADERGNPLIGHLMVAWPAEAPLFLAVFRSFGVNGAGNLRRAAKTLEKWAVHYPSRMGKVRVRLLALAPRSSWQVLDECPTLEREGADGGKVRISTCGRFRIVSQARGSRPERQVAGILSSMGDGSEVVLETDPETYADAVLAAEAQDLQKEARKALRAVIVWNGTHGRNRHEETSSLCDTTHCMVFQGTLPEAGPERRTQTDPKLLQQLDELAARKNLDWFPFSKGGSEPWVREIPASTLLQWVGESSILDLRRERTRTGNVVIHLMYAENEEIVPCEAFRNRLKLLSCPEAIHFDTTRSTWIFSGIGEGHGEGLSVAKARALSRAGHPAAAILADAYQ